MWPQFAVRLVIGMTSYEWISGLGVGLSTNQASQLFRIGHGYDLHRLQVGGRLMLAGIEVAQNLSPIAHSDGDVVLHAVVDALCGALALGDIGEHFPNTDPRWKDASSRVFVEEL